MNTTSVTPDKNKLSSKGSYSRSLKTPDRRRPRQLWLLALAGSVTVVIGVALWILYAWPAALVISFVTALCGLAKALIELYLFLVRQDTNITKKKGRRWSKWALAPVVSAALLSGIGIGFAVLPRLVETVSAPTARLQVSGVVGATQPATVSWRNVPADDDIRVFVRSQGKTIDFVQPCRGLGGKPGIMSCDLEMGGTDAADTQFEIRVVRLPRKSSNEFAASAEGSYVTSWPEGTHVLYSKTVVRR